jgi:hypothetical protein
MLQGGPVDRRGNHGGVNFIGPARQEKNTSVKSQYPSKDSALDSTNQYGNIPTKNSLDISSRLFMPCWRYLFDASDSGPT